MHAFDGLWKLWKLCKVVHVLVFAWRYHMSLKTSNSSADCRLSLSSLSDGHHKDKRIHSGLCSAVVPMLTLLSITVDL